MEYGYWHHVLYQTYSGRLYMNICAVLVIHQTDIGQIRFLPAVSCTCYLNFIFSEVELLGILRKLVGRDYRAAMVSGSSQLYCACR